MDRNTVRRLDVRIPAAVTSHVNTMERAQRCVDPVEDLNATARKRVTVGDSVKSLSETVQIM